MATPDSNHLTCEETGLEFVIYRSPVDGTLVVHIDTDPELHPENADGPELRVYVNDGLIDANPDLPELDGVDAAELALAHRAGELPDNF